jgi:hypothetical protein
MPLIDRDKFTKEVDKLTSDVSKELLMQLLRAIEILDVTTDELDDRIAELEGEDIGDLEEDIEEDDEEGKPAA